MTKNLMKYMNRQIQKYKFQVGKTERDPHQHTHYKQTVEDKGIEKYWKQQDRSNSSFT